MAACFPAGLFGAELTATEAVVAHVERIELSPKLRAAMLTVVRQHPEVSRWSGTSDNTVFSIATRRLGEAGEKDPATPALVRLTAAQAANELLMAKSLLEVYESAQLNDATTLRAAVEASTEKLVIEGHLQAISLNSSPERGYAVSVAFGDRQRISAMLVRPADLKIVQEAYRDVMHAQARDLMARMNWPDALLLWHHLHQRKLVSQGLYLDAARCFAAQGKGDDVVKVLDEAIRSFVNEAPSAFFEQAGDVALGLKTNDGDLLAEQAYKLASQKLSQ
jgi:hypothetical protein